MPASESQKKATAKYRNKTYERIPFVFRLDDSALNGDVIRAHANAQGESVNSFIRRAIAETIERDKEKRIASKFA